LKTKQAGLVKDLERVLAKYDARDWQLIVRLLTANSKLLFQAISAAEAKSSKIEKVRSKKGADTPNVATSTRNQS
jgi:hypothetical protein